MVYMRNHKKLKTVTEYGNDILRILLVPEASDSDMGSIDFKNIPKLVPTIILEADSLPLHGIGKRLVVLEVFNQILNNHISEREMDTCKWFIENQLPDLIEQTVLIAKSKAMVKSIWSCLF